jgi:hypothetical protein
MDAGPDTSVAGKCGNNQLTVPGGASALSTLGGNTPANAIDGNLTTRWESAHGVDPEWIDLDFGTPVFLRDVQVLWEAACAKNYTLQISSDGTNWKVIATITNNTLAGNMIADGKTPTDWTKAVDSPNLNVIGRYLRVNGTVRCSVYGYSIWEMREYGDKNAACTP